MKVRRYSGIEPWPQRAYTSVTALVKIHARSWIGTARLSGLAGLIGLAGLAVLCPAPGGELPQPGSSLREPVHPRRTVEVFPAVEARAVRFTVRATNRGEPCLDELEIYGPDDDQRNLALAAGGARATSSGSLPGYAIHDLKGVNDGMYGNGRSWIADRQAGAWVQIELPAAAIVDRIVWSRDREGKFIDRLPTEYVIEVSREPGVWQRVASSDDREVLPWNHLGPWFSPATRHFVNRFVPVGTTLSPEETASSEYTLDRWQSSDGLPGNTVTAISQAPDGYLWLGTLNGVVRFDGMKFEVFGEEAGLPSVRVLCLLHDRRGELWIGTEGGGLARWSRTGFERWGFSEGMPSETVLSLAEDASGRIWIGTTAGLSCWHRGALLQPIEPRPNAGASILRIVPLGDDLWCVVDGAIVVRRDGHWVRPEVASEPSQFSSLFALHRGPSGGLWFGGANNYLGRLEGGNVQVFPEQAGHLLHSVWEVVETQCGDVWLGTANGGLRRWRNGTFLSITTQEGLSDNSIRSLCEDREGNLWVGTVGGGLNRIKPKRLRTFTTRDGLAHNVVMSLAEDDRGALWVGSNCGGLSVMQEERFEPLASNYLLDNACIWSLLPARDGALWIGTWGGGLFRKRGREITPFVVSQRANDEPVIALCEDRSGALWVGTYQGGLQRFHDGRFQRFHLGEEGPHVAVTTILEDEDAGLWVGTASAGLHHVDASAVAQAGWDVTEATLQSRAWTRRDGLPSDAIRTVCLDGSGVMWVGTGSGLARLERGNVRTFTREHGLPDEVISQIIEDDDHNLWLGTNRGIFRVARAALDEASRTGRLAVTIFGRDEGMEGVECTGGFHPAGLKTRDGRLWFSTVKGLVRIEPDTIRLNDLPPPVVIERVLVDGTELGKATPGGTGAVAGTRSGASGATLGAAAGAPTQTEAGSGGAVLLDDMLRIEPGNRRIEFQFTALSLVAPERNRFRYRLEGAEADWVEAGSQRVAAYTRLAPGRYRFRVQASNQDGCWNETGATLAIRVLPPFWSTSWFIALSAGLALAGGGWTVRRWSNRKLHRQLERLERQHALEQERARIARDIHDDLGATLTQISLLTEIAQKRRDRPEEMAVHLRRISDASREMVQAMDAIVWAVNPRNDSLDHLANYISQFAEEFFRHTSVRCRLDVPADLPEQPLSAEARHHLFLATKEALNNVARHSGADEVWLRVGVDDRDFVIRVEDNGRGVGAGTNGSGDGLRNIRQRLEEIGGRLEVDTCPDRGWTLKLVLRLPER